MCLKTYISLTTYRSYIELLSDSDPEELLSDCEPEVQQVIEESFHSRFTAVCVHTCMYACLSIRPSIRLAFFVQCEVTCLDEWFDCVCVYILLSTTYRHHPTYDSETVEKVLSEHAEKNVVIGDLPEDQQEITVRRRHIWNDAKRALKRPLFNGRIGITINFIGEPAQDAGGPLREFFTLLWQSLARNNSLFNGPEDSRTLVHNVYALQQEEYAIIGRLIALALMYGGTAPHFFSPSVVSYLFDGPPVDIVSDVIEVEIQHKIRQVSFPFIKIVHTL